MKWNFFRHTMYFFTTREILFCVENETERGTKFYRMQSFLFLFHGKYVNQIIIMGFLLKVMMRESYILRHQNTIYFSWVKYVVYTTVGKVVNPFFVFWNDFWIDEPAKINWIFPELLWASLDYAMELVSYLIIFFGDIFCAETWESRLLVLACTHRWSLSALYFFLYSGHTITIAFWTIHTRHYQDSLVKPGDSAMMIIFECSKSTEILPKDELLTNEPTLLLFPYLHWRERMQWELRSRIFICWV